MGCSDMFENPVPWPGDLEVEEPKYDLENNVVKDQDQSPGALQKDNITSLFELQQQYQQDCYKQNIFSAPLLCFWMKYGNFN